MRSPQVAFDRVSLLDRQFVLPNVEHSPFDLIRLYGITTLDCSRRNAAIVAVSTESIRRTDASRSWKTPSEYRLPALLGGGASTTKRTNQQMAIALSESGEDQAIIFIISFQFPLPAAMDAGLKNCNRHRPCGFDDLYRIFLPLPVRPDGLLQFGRCLVVLDLTAQC